VYGCKTSKSHVLIKLGSSMHVALRVAIDRVKEAYGLLKSQNGIFGLSFLESHHMVGKLFHD
jgi:hypothetical protein